MESPVIDPEEPDIALLARFRRGDQSAFAALVLRYQKAIFNAAFRVVGNAPDAADVTQEVFLKIVERLDDYDHKYKFFSWIYRIAVNESIDVLRRARREEPLEDDEDSQPPDLLGPDGRYQSRQVGDRVQQALLRMTLDHRIVLTMRHFSEMSYQEISAVLAIDEKTVKSRLFEARQVMALHLADFRP
ncbi:MAG TPA: sigma-70 family RNA polymerase sigma factor [Ramlibacter sp.]|nr:sigma-70 family RNA polymerase sigma factor [Ramlibacter sp.]